MLGRGFFPCAGWGRYNVGGGGLIQGSIHQTGGFITPSGVVLPPEGGGGSPPENKGYRGGAYSHWWGGAFSGTTCDSTPPPRRRFLCQSCSCFHGSVNGLFLLHATPPWHLRTLTPCATRWHRAPGTGAAAFCNPKAASFSPLPARSPVVFRSFLTHSPPRRLSLRLRS